MLYAAEGLLRKLFQLQIVPVFWRHFRQFADTAGNPIHSVHLTFQGEGNACPPPVPLTDSFRLNRFRR